VSAAGGGGAACGFSVNVVVSVVALSVAEIVTLVVAPTVVVLIAKLADEAPAAIVILAGKLAAALLLAKFTTVAEEAGPLKVTEPWTAFPPVTDAGFTLTADSVTAGGGGVWAGVTVKTT
jgi:hypothetical protein